ncbi:MAG TPA: M56 family metallopeptidase [Blastocatellia bacterium]|nr:M56 family metallopeptidase [Blastocatellia bacterium]
MNALTNPFVTASAKGAAWMLVWSWQAAVLLACVLAGLKICRVKSPALRHQVWLFALIAVAAMPVLGGVVKSLPLPQPSNRALSYAVELPRIVVTDDAAPVVQYPAQATSVKPSIKQPIILSLSFALWLTGALIFVTKAVISGARVRRLRNGARLASLADLDCDECDCEMLRSGKARLALSDEIRAPILLGALRPMIVFPADIAAWTSPTERCAMLRHELAHVERRDHYVNLFQAVLGAVFFFHPLARYSCRQLTMEREMACDDHVVGSGAEAEAYAESIIKAAERSIGALGGAHQLAFFSSRQILERRIEMIMNKDRARVIARKWRYLIPPVALIAAVTWLLLPARLTKSGLAQQGAGDLNELVARYAEDSKNFDDLVEMALTSPDLEIRQKAILRLYIIEGGGTSAALAEVYKKSNDPAIKGMVIRCFGRRGESEQLATIAQTEQSPEFRQMANEAIKYVKENIFDLELISAENLKFLKDFTVIDDQAKDTAGNQVIELKKPLLVVTDGQGRMPPPPPPPPPPSDAMTVAAGQELKPAVGDGGMFDLLREAADASIRRDTTFFERALDEDYRETGPNGETLNKAQAIAEVKRLDLTIKKFEFDDLNVSGNNHSAFATFLGTVYFQANGQDSTAQFRYTVNFIRRDGQWKIAAIQMTQKH